MHENRGFEETTERKLNISLHNKLRINNNSKRKLLPPICYNTIMINTINFHLKRITNKKNKAMSREK
jgi:hypothetical protein